MTDIKVQTGDVIIVWDKDIIGKVLRFAISRIFAIKNPANHAEMAFDEEIDISAEPQGVVFQNRAKRMKKAKKYVVARNVKITPELQRELQNYSYKYFGKPYDYYLSALWYLRFTLVFAPFVWLFSRIFAWWLKRNEQKAYMCSELVSELYGDIGFSFGLDDHSFVTPSDIFQVIKACPDWKIIYIYEE